MAAASGDHCAYRFHPSEVNKQLLLAYALAVLVGTIGLLLVLSPLSSNDGVLHNKEMWVVGVSAAVALICFLLTVRRSGLGHAAIATNAAIAAVLLPLAIVFTPLLYCVFIGHGTCS